MGWWEDPLCRVWRAPDEPIQQPSGDPTSFETLAVAFEPPEAGWIDFVLASYRQVALIRISYLYSSGAEIVAWLEEVARGGFPRVAISEEGSFGELHLFPGDRFPPSVTWQPPRRDHVRLCVILRCIVGAKLKLDVVMPRKALVRAIYRAWLACHDDDPERFLDQWSRFGHDDDMPDVPFARSVFLEEWLGIPSRPTL
ncbi:MAG: hypothetical protein B7Y95_04280 [Rhizobiales bacterium 32-66-11]|nr:MAG: hypothetical protein B7Y95_04280 [Rhizobiales bacterium 32-66-11]